MNHEFGFSPRERFGKPLPDGLFYAQTSVQAGDTINTTAADTSFATTFDIPMNTLWPGQVWEFDYHGLQGSAAAGAGNQLMNFKFGSTVVVPTLTHNLATSITARPWWIHIQLTVISIGATGTVEAHGFGYFHGHGTSEMRGMSNAAVVTINTTTANTVNLSTDYSVSDVANTITLRQSYAKVFSP